jgi:hypothetical protein
MDLFVLYEGQFESEAVAVFKSEEIARDYLEKNRCSPSEYHLVQVRANEPYSYDAPVVWGYND